MSSRSLRTFVLGIVLLAGTAVAQDEPPDRPGRRVTSPRVPELPVEPVPIAPDPDRELLERFHRDLDVTTSAARELRLQRAMRIAPFDLAWSLR